MGLEIAPEIKMARRLLKKHSLTVPFDLKKLVSEYAQVIYKTIPIEGIDGVCINLKNPKKTTKIIVNNSSSIKRQRFTLAHELGHIMIPWHLGTIVDHIDSDQNKSVTDNQYWINEREANLFASELLMPFDWLYARYLENNDLDDLISLTCSVCTVSEEAARIRINRFWNEVINYLLPKSVVIDEYTKSQKLEKIQRSLMEKMPFHPLYIARKMTEYLGGKIAFCIEEKNIVIGCGSTNGTRDYYQFEGEEFKENPYPYFKTYSTYTYQEIITHWWDLEVSFDKTDDDRTWQEILNVIANDLVEKEDVSKFKSKLNGSLSGLSGNWKRKHQEMKVEDFINDVMQRFNNIDDMHILKHPDFAKFIRKRSIALFGHS